MRRFLAGLVVGGVLVMGVAQAIPPPGDWTRAPMDAGEYTFLFEHGYCEKGTKIKRVPTYSGRPSNNYACVEKDRSTPPAP